jgi:hypothetical protein
MSTGFAAGVGLAKKKIAIGLVIIALALFLVNVIFGYIVVRPDNTSRRRCIYSLHRVGVALVEYCNVKNTTLTPHTLQTLVDEGVLEAHWLRCSEFAPQFGYFGQFDLLAPRPPVVLWCKSGHIVLFKDRPVKVTPTLSGNLTFDSYPSRSFANVHKTLDLIHGIFDSGDSEEDIDRLLRLSFHSVSSTARLCAIWKLGQMRSKKLEETFLNLFKHSIEDVLKKLNSKNYKERQKAHMEMEVRYEAAHALALIGNPAGGAALLLYLRDPDYFTRLRAFSALKELTGDDFGFNPVLDARSQPKAMAGFDGWWAKTMKSLRKSASGSEE